MYVCVCPQIYVGRAPHQDGRPQLYIAGQLIIPHFTKGRISQKLYRFQEANLQNLVNVEEMIQYWDKASNLKRFFLKKVTNS